MIAAIDPRDDAALVADANDAIGRDDLNTAIVALRELVRRHPGNAPLVGRLATLLNNRGTRAARAGFAASAATDWDESLRLQPMQVPARLNRGRLHAAERQWREAVQHLEVAHGLAPNDPEVMLEWADARAHATTNDDAGALDALRDAVDAAGRVQAVAPMRLACAAATLGIEALADAALDATDETTSVSSWLDVAQRWCEAGDTERARGTYARAMTRGARDLRLALGARLALPTVYRDREEMIAARATFIGGIGALRAKFDPDDPRPSGHALDELAWSAAALAFQGHDDRDVLSRLGDWHAAMARRLAPAALRDRPRARRDGPPRLALIAPDWRDTAMTAYFGAWVEALAASDIACTLVALDTRVDQVRARLAARCAATLVLAGDLATMATTLHGAAFDALLYVDAGVDPRLRVLAGLRLAPVQLAGWNHPQTTGLPTVDAAISCAAMEPHDGAAQYRERLIALPQLGTRYAAPPHAAAAPPAVLDALDLPRGRRYLVPHVAAKLHVDFDAIAAEVAARDPEGTLVFVGVEQPAVRARLRRRLGDALRRLGADPGRQLRFVPRVPHATFVALCAASTVMLDPPHWSGGANAYDALASGLPVVTHAGAAMRGRQSAAMARVLGVDASLVVRDPRLVAERAVAIATDADRREAIARDLRDRRDALFDADAALRALVEAVREAIGR